MTASPADNPQETPAMIPDATRFDAPKELTLSDRVSAFLEMRGGLRSDQIRVSEHDGAIVLEGAVRRYYDRQVALTCAQHVSGVRHVIDRIVVRESRQKAGDPAAR